MKKTYDLRVEEHEHNGAKLNDVVMYFGEKRFVLVPLSPNKRVRRYFYALLNGEAKA